MYAIAIAAGIATAHFAMIIRIRFTFFRNFLLSFRSRVTASEIKPASSTESRLSAGLNPPSVEAYWLAGSHWQLLDPVKSADEPGSD